ncbi:acyltransferase [Cyanobium sp. Aljojuca 7D2]|nr:acyltransferase [Cyanobium sp. Aljojuca 7D2]
MGPATATWLPGLDVVRAAAIVLVVFAHGRVLLPRGTALDQPWLAPAHWGIELFFALSGYLIVSQLVAVLAGGSWHGLRVFCWKRFLRTMPVYWIMLALLSLMLPAEIRFQVWLREALFLRTFPVLSNGVDPLLAVNWSLAVEEMSYVLLALLTAALLRYRHLWRGVGLSERAVLTGLMLLLIGIGLASRAWAVNQGFSLDQLKFSAVLHVDALAYGGLARLWAGGQSARPGAMAGTPWLLGVALLPITAWIGFVVRAPYLLEGQRSTDLLTHSCMAYGISRIVAAGLVLAVAAVPPAAFTKNRLWVSLISTTAAASYSTYLLHQVLVLQWARQLKNQAPGLSGELFMLYLLLSLALGYLSYQVLERPWIKLRQRLTV